MLKLVGNSGCGKWHNSPHWYKHDHNLRVLEYYRWRVAQYLTLLKIQNNCYQYNWNRDCKSFNIKSLSWNLMWTHKTFLDKVKFHYYNWCILQKNVLAFLVSDKKVTECNSVELLELGKKQHNLSFFNSVIWTEEPNNSSADILLFCG